MVCDHNYTVEGMNDDFQRMVCDKCGAEKPPFVITNARVSYPQLRSPSYPIGEGAKSFRLSIKRAYDDSFGSFRWCFLAAFVASAGGDPTSTIVGYDPQKLLPSNRRCEQCLAEFDAPHIWHHTREHWIERPHFCDVCSQARFASMAALFQPAYLRDALKDMVLDLSEGGEATLTFDPATGRHRRLAPFVSPMPNETVTAWVKRHREIDVTRWNESDADPLADIDRWRKRFLYDEFDDRFPELAAEDDARLAEINRPAREPTWPHKMAVIDYRTIERDMLGRLLRDGSVRAIFMDFESSGGEIERLDDAGRRLFPLGVAYEPKGPPEPQVVATSSGKRDMSYLKHDRTKSHRRRKR